MAEGKSAATKVREQAQQNPGANRLKEELEHYIEARLALMLEGVGHRLGEGARRLGEAHMSPAGVASVVGKGAKKLGEQGLGLDDASDVDHRPSDLGEAPTGAGNRDDAT